MKALSQNLLDLLSDHNVTFFIPPYQRNYEWDKSQCEAFWEDVLNTNKKNKAGEMVEHFFWHAHIFSFPVRLWRTGQTGVDRRATAYHDDDALFDCHARLGFG